MKRHLIEQGFAYDGTQLRSLFAYMDYGILGDSVVAWQGSCEIPFEHMVDGEDVRVQSPIRGDKMLHFICEFFGMDLFTAVAIQRLMASIAADLLRDRGIAVRRSGDDVYVADKKFSISIATVSPVSALIHFAVNVTNDGTPVPTAALSDFFIDPREFADQLMDNLAREIETIREATCKVRWVK